MKYFWKNIKQAIYKEKHFDLLKILHSRGGYAHFQYLTIYTKYG